MVSRSTAPAPLAGSKAKLKSAPPLSIRYQAIARVLPNPNNPRRHSQKQVDQIARSIKTFGWVVPVAVDDDNRLISGHGRLLAAVKLGMTEIPTVRISHLTEDQKRAYTIADNRLTINSEWNETLLGEQLALLANANLDFDISVTGFDIAEIDLAIEGLNAPAGNVDPDDEALALLPVVTKLGDVWRLGSHTILCGDALDPRSYAVVMPNEEAAVVFTDPPFNVKVSSVSGKGKRKHREFAMASGEMSRREFSDFLRSAFEQLVNHSRDGSIHFICMDFRHMTELLAAGESVYDELKNLVVWVKSNGGMGSLYRSRHELIFVFKSGTAAHQNHVELGRYGRNRSNAWEYPSPRAFGQGENEGDLLREHPTPKPVAMIADALMDVSSRGEIVLDPFLGSGSTLLAAERVGRLARGIELDPRYVDLTIRRWERKTGRSAVHVEKRLTFAEVVEMREVGHD